MNLRRAMEEAYARGVLSQPEVSTLELMLRERWYTDIAEQLRAAREQQERANALLRTLLSE